MREVVQAELLFEGESLPEPPRPTQIGQAIVEYATTADILTKATGFMDAYDYTLNPYSGCSYGCTYCYAAFFSRTPEKRDTWGYWVRVKENAIERLRKKYPAGSLNGKLIYMSSVTDPYQPVERKVKITKELLEVLSSDHKPHLVVQTRSPDIVRDANLYREIVENGGKVQINMTVTTDDEEIRSQFEPYCPGNSRRLDAIGAMTDQGFQTCVTMTPLIWLNDPDTFAEQLVATGVKRFISQPFHFNRGKFVAKTREGAFRLMAEKLACGLPEFRGKYLKRYGEWRSTLEKHMPPDSGLTLGQGKDGFSPPF